LRYLIFKRMLFVCAAAIITLTITKVNFPYSGYLLCGYGLLIADFIYNDMLFWRRMLKNSEKNYEMYLSAVRELITTGKEIIATEEVKKKGVDNGSSDNRAG
jgi:hypothetical protein